MIVWRLERAEYVDTALAGEGASRFGGRWNLPGTPIVYASSSLSLAAYERFVHAPGTDRHVALVAVGIQLPHGTTPAALRPLPSDWRSPAPPASTMQLGSAWAQEAKALLASVPSVLLPLDLWEAGTELNLLINPNHPRAGALRVVSALPFAFDARVWK
jgi:RES domain-containing protein